MEKLSKGCNTALSLVKKKKKEDDKPDLLSLNMKPIKPIQLWIQNEKNGEQV